MAFARMFFGLGLALLASRAAVHGAECSDFDGIPTEVDGFEDVCCAPFCEPCGGSGCSDQPGGASSCCANAITSADNFCSSDKTAPCLLGGPTPAPVIPEPTPAPTEAPEPMCSEYGGIPVGIDGFENVCCAPFCEPCGGSGCSSQAGGPSSCCANTITNADRLCSEDQGAPCLLPEATPAPTSIDCKAALSDSDLEQLSIYDKDIFVDPACIDGEPPLHAHCNYMGKGQECRGCFTTCDGALRYMDDYAAEIAVWGEETIIHFCAGADVDTLEECSP